MRIFNSWKYTRFYLVLLVASPCCRKSDDELRICQGHLKEKGWKREKVKVGGYSVERMKDRRIDKWRREAHPAFKWQGSAAKEPIRREVRQV